MAHLLALVGVEAGEVLTTHKFSADSRAGPRVRFWTDPDCHTLAFIEPLSNHLFDAMGARRDLQPDPCLFPRFRYDVGSRCVVSFGDREAYKRRIAELIAEFPVVATLDVDQFYPSIEAWHVRYGLDSAGVRESLRHEVEGVLPRWRRGLPLGHVFSDLIAWAVLRHGDDWIVREGLPILRWQDDYLVFGRTDGEARALLARLKNMISEAGFSPNASKEFVHSEADVDLLISGLKPMGLNVAPYRCFHAAQPFAPAPASGYLPSNDQLEPLDWTALYVDRLSAGRDSPSHDLERECVRWALRQGPCWLRRLVCWDMKHYPHRMRDHAYQFGRLHVDEQEAICNSVDGQFVEDTALIAAEECLDAPSRLFPALGSGLTTNVARSRFVRAGGDSLRSDEALVALCEGGASPRCLATVGSIARKDFGRRRSRLRRAVESSKLGALLYAHLG